MSRITVRAMQPPELERLGGWKERLGRAAGLIHTGTKPEVVLAFLRIQPGDRCSELTRTESARVLRAQPFFADATIRVVEVSADTVELEVATEEELRPNVGLRLENGQMTKLRLGSANFAGQALAFTLLYRKGFHYRDGFGIRLVDYQPFRRPWVLNLEAIRNPLGGSWAAALREPFYTELHAHTWYAGAERRRAYHGYRRPDGADVSVEFDRTRWLVGAAWRVGDARRAAFVGPVLAGERSREHGGPGIVTDTGVVAFTDAGIAAGNRDYGAFRAGGLVGFHRISHSVAYGLDALSGPQDVQSGIEILSLTAPSIRTTGTNIRDVLFGGSLYIGAATTDGLLALQAEGESRRTTGDAGRWEGTVTSARAAWYAKPRPGRLRIVSTEFSGSWRTRLPVQTTLAARDFGIRGFGDARVGGAHRLVVRLEQRWVTQRETRRWDLGTALFGDAGWLWAGDAPFGHSTALQASVGVALVAAVPRGARHTWRIDLAVPVTSAGNQGQYAIRASVTDHTRRFWRDPGEVARVREGPLLSRILGGR